MIRIAIRTLRKSGGVTAAAVAVLALCIGANTAIFTVVSTVLWKSLPFAQPDRLVDISEQLGQVTPHGGPLSAPDYLFLESSAKSFATLAAYSTREWELSGTERPDRVTGARVSASLFPLLGVAPQVGRVFSSEEDKNGRAVAVLSYQYWRQAFGGARDVLGRKVYLDRTPYTVVGVMPPSFVFPVRHAGYNGVPANVYVPISWTTFERTGYGYMFNKSVIGRLRPGISIMQAAAETRAILNRFREHYPADFRSDAQFQLSAVVTAYHETVAGSLRPVMLVLLSAAGLVLLIGCANVANLLLTRSVQRGREYAIRTALGASRLTLLGQGLAEGLLLSLSGGAGGVLLAVWITPVLVRTMPMQIPRLGEIGIDFGALLFTLAVCCLIPFLFGMAPATEAARLNLSNALRDGGRSGTAGGRQRRWMNIAVVSQYALAVLLLAGSGLLVRSFLELRRVDPGFQAEHVLTMAVKLPAASYKSGREVMSFYDSVLQQTRALAGVRMAGAISDLPLKPSDQWGLAIEGKRADSGVPRSILLSWVSGDALQALGVKLLRGRLLTDADRGGSQNVVVINETMARQAWPNEDPIGRRIGLGGEPDSDSDWVTVVGVIADIRQGLHNVDTRPQVFQPQAQGPGMVVSNAAGVALRDMHLVMRCSIEPAALVNVIRERIVQRDAALPVTEIVTLDRYVSDSITEQRFDAWLIGVFAALALGLALIGIGGLLLYMVVWRTRELGIRMALGGSKLHVVGLVLGDGARLAAAGTGLGLVTALALTRFLAGLLYQVSSFDPLTFTLVPVMVAVITLIAGALPAWRAARIEPTSALRAE